MTTNQEPVPATNQAGEVDWTRTKAFDEAAAECMRAAAASTFADTVSEDERKGYRSACNLMAMNFHLMASHAAPELATQPATSQEGEEVPPMPECDSRQLWGDDEPDGYLESDRDWSERNSEVVTWLADNHTAIRNALAATPTPPTLSEDLREALELLRRREMQMMGAAISTRSWHDMETAYNAGRDRLDAVLIEIRRAARALGPE